MREILFRGKRADNGEWVEGFYTHKMNPYTPNGLPIKHFILDLAPFGVDVLPETVGQYTGLTDNNNRKIFEGDIVKCTDTINDFEFNAVVEFGNPNGEYNWGYQLKFISGEESNFDILCWVDMKETGAYIEIIGNIHDNPELLGTAAKPIDKNIAQSGLAPATENFELMEG